VGVLRITLLLLSLLQALAYAVDPPDKSDAKCSGGADGENGYKTKNLADLIVAQDDETRAMCLLVIENKISPWSQLNQDTFIFHNFLKARGNHGVYVDVGAYDPLEISNTAFFYLCLGWKGLCIELNPLSRSDFEKHRSCTFINECVSDRELTTTLDQG